MESQRKCFSLSRGRVSAYPPILQRNFPPQHPFIIYIVRITFFFLWIVSFFGNNCVFVFFSMYFFPIVFSAQIYFPRRAHFEGQATWLQWSCPSPSWWLWQRWACQWLSMGSLFPEAVTGTCIILSIVGIGHDQCLSIHQPKKMENVDLLRIVFPALYMIMRFICSFRYNF